MKSDTLNESSRTVLTAEKFVARDNFVIGTKYQLIKSDYEVADIGYPLEFDCLSERINGVVDVVTRISGSWGVDKVVVNDGICVGVAAIGEGKGGKVSSQDGTREQTKTERDHS